jgi:hypothetical protein
LKALQGKWDWTLQYKKSINKIIKDGFIRFLLFYKVFLTNILFYCLIIKLFTMEEAVEKAVALSNLVQAGKQIKNAAPESEFNVLLDIPEDILREIGSDQCVMIGDIALECMEAFQAKPPRLNKADIFMKLDEVNIILTAVQHRLKDEIVADALMQTQEIKKEIEKQLEKTT